MEARRLCSTRSARKWVRRGYRRQSSVPPRVQGALVEKYLVHDQRQPVLPAHCFERGRSISRVKWPVGLLRWTRAMARVWGVIRRQGLKVELPAMIVEELIRNQLDVIQLGQEIKEG